MQEDQAAELRSLVHQFGAQKNSQSPQIVVVSGGKSGVGTSTIAATTAAVLAKAGRRVVLVDADPRSPKLASFCPESRESVPYSDGTLSKIAVGFGLLTAPWAKSDGSQNTYRLSDLNQFASGVTELGDQAEFAIVDAGNGVSAESRAFWSVSDAAIVATGTDGESMMASYSVVKSMHTLQANSRIVASVSRSDDRVTAADVYRRFSQSCQRFLGQELVDGGGIPVDPLLANSLNESPAGVLGISESPAVCAIEQVVGQLKATLRQQAVRRSA